SPRCTKSHYVSSDAPVAVTPRHDRRSSARRIRPSELDFLLTRRQCRITQPSTTRQPARHISPILTLHSHRQTINRDRLVISQLPGDTDLPIVREDLRVSHRTIESNRHRRRSITIISHKPRTNTTSDSSGHREHQRENDSTSRLRHQTKRHLTLVIIKRPRVSQLEIAHKPCRAALALHITIR